MRFLTAAGRARNGTVTELAAAGRRPDLLAESRARRDAPAPRPPAEPIPVEDLHRAWSRAGHLDPYVFGRCPDCERGRCNPTSEMEKVR